MTAELPAHLEATRSRAHAGARLVLRGMALNAFFAVVKISGGLLGVARGLPG